MANTKTQAKADGGRDEEFLAVLQESNDLAATATMNTARANEMAEAASSKAAAEGINVAQGAGPCPDRRLFQRGGSGCRAPRSLPLTRYVSAR